MKPLFLEFISLNNELEEKGGRGAIMGNPDLEPLYEKTLEIEDEILNRFGLPKLMKFRDIIFNLTSEKDFESIENQLKKAAEYYLTSSPTKHFDLLEDAKINDLKTYDVLPELGIEDNLYAMFIFEEYFKKGEIGAKELINILSSIDAETSIKIGYLYFYTVDEPNLEKATNIQTELSERKINYLTEYLKFRPVYPY